MSQRVSIVLVNYNGKEYLKDLLDSIAAQDYESIDVILVDNGSTDGSVEWLKSNYSTITLIESKKNEGFGEGCNAGIDYAIAHDAEYILLLNTDTIPKKNLVSELVKYADCETVTTATTYCGEKNAKQLWYSGGEIDYITANTNQVLYREENQSPTYEVEFISGCCMLIHRSIFEKVGRFDKNFYLYYEDTDFCVRMKKAHITMLYVTTTSLWHKVGGSSAGGNEMSCSTQYYVTRNRLLFAEKHADLFIKGNLGVLREILKERAFFAGINNEKYELYVKAAIADFLKMDFGRGYYGRTLLEERFYVLAGFYEREVGDAMFWYCAGDISASIMIVNPQKRNVIYNVSFDVAKEDEADSSLQVEIDGREFQNCSFPGHIEFMLFVEAEQKVKMNLLLQGKNISKSVRSDGNDSYYQLLNLKVKEQETNFYYGTSFLPKESDEENEWYWSSEQTGDIYLVNNKEELLVNEIKFSVVPYEKSTAGKITLLQDGKKAAEIEPEREANYWLPVQPKSVSKLTICTDMPVKKGERNLCFNVNNLRVESIKDNFYFGNSFYPKESDGTSEWYWSSEQTGDIYLVNNKEELLVNEIKFSVVPYEKNTAGKITILQDGKKVAEIEPEREVNYWIPVPPKSVSRLTICTDMPVKKGERALCFNVNNLSVKRLKDKFYFGNSFYSKESDGVSEWYWSSEQTGDIYFVNNEDKLLVNEVKFNVVPYEKNTAGKITILQDGEKVAEIEAEREVNYWIPVPPKSVSRLTICTDMPVKKGERALCFNVNNLSVESIKDNFYFGNSFYPKESDGCTEWYWSSEQTGDIYFVNNEDKLLVNEVRFSVVPYEKNTAGKITILQDGDKVAEMEPESKMDCRLPVPPKSVSRLTICTDMPVKKGERTLCFNINNIGVQSIKDNFYFGNSFYPKESNGASEWYWSSEQNGDIFIVNSENRKQINLVKFGVTPFENLEDAYIEIWYDGSKKIQVTSMENMKFLIEVPENSITRLTIHGNMPIREMAGRNLCFNINNFFIIPVQEYVCFERSFYAQESNENDVWCWAYEQEAEIVLCYEVAKDVKLSFSIGCIPEFTGETVELMLDGKNLGEYTYNRKICIPVKADKNIGIHRLKFKAAHQPFHVEGDSRKFAFQVLNFYVNADD